MSEVNYAVSSLDELINEKQDLIALMSHDLKNPLAAVMSYTEMIATDPKYTVLANKILEASTTQKNIINSVLEMLEQDNVVITKEELDKVDLNNIFKGIIDRYSNKQTEKNIKVNLNIDYAFIKADTNLISQVFENVYSNSLKFTENGEINISSKLTDNSVKILIEDTGIGFDQNIASKLFDRFTTYKRKGTKNEATTGLGLYLCKKIITKHQGSISAVSQGKDKGSRFEIILPAFV